MSSVVPQRLRKGDLIAVVSPASPPQQSSRLARGVDALLEQGFRVRLGLSVGLEQGYLAGDDALRARDINDALMDPSVRAIFCTRGGYGSARLLPLLKWDALRENAKILLGFSDITALSLAAYAKAGMRTFAGPMVAAEFGSGILPATADALWDMLMRPVSKRELAVGPDARTLRAGKADGPLLGGNLAVLTSLIGSPWLPSFKDSILFLEDVGEPVYRIDRMLLQLRYAGVFDGIAGVVLGRFTGIPDASKDRPLLDVIEEYLLPLQVPVMHSISFGHIPDKITLPIGTPVALDAGGCRLTMVAAAVR